MLTTAEQLVREKRSMQQEKLGIAKRMRKAEMPKEQVAAFTGLDHSQIDKLLQELNQ